jgi:flagellar protein FliO/FliZ
MIRPLIKIGGQLSRRILNVQNWLLIGGLWLSVSLSLWPTLGEAAESDQELPSVGDMGTASLKTLASLLLVIGLILCAFYVLKRSRLAPFAMHRNANMRVVGTLSLAPKRSVALVEVYDQWLVLGVGTENVTLLSKMDRGEEGGLANSLPSADSSPFQSLLHKMAFRNRQAMPKNWDKNDA